jgi:hypothetical protein
MGKNLWAIFLATILLSTFGLTLPLNANVSSTEVQDRQFFYQMGADLTATFDSPSLTQSENLPVIEKSALSILQADYNWPIAPVNQQHSITGTLGEYRTGDEFHWGVDIPAPEGTNVLSVVGGTVQATGFADTIRVGNTWYGHVKNSVPAGTVVNAGDKIAEVGPHPTPHLHFAEMPGPGSDNPLNPLRNGGLSPFTDTNAPTVNSIDVTQNGGAAFATAYIFGKADIKSDAKDSMTIGANTVGVYKIGYLIQNTETADIIEDWIYNIVFDTNPSHARIWDCYAPGTNDLAVPPVFIYWVTNNPFCPGTEDPDNDYYWNTKQKAGAAKNVDGTKNTEARFWDDEYWTWVCAKDINGNDAIKSLTIRVDNFIPSIIEVAPLNGAMNVPVNTEITVTFSEKMNRASVENAFTLIGGGETFDKTKGTFTWSNIKVGTARVSKMVFKPNVDLKFDTEYVAKITTGAKDLVDKTLASDYTWTFKTHKPSAVAIPKNIVIQIPNVGRNTGAFSIHVTNPTNHIAISVSMEFKWTGPVPQDTTVGVLTGFVSINPGETKTIGLPSFSVGPNAKPGTFPCEITWTIGAPERHTGFKFTTDPNVVLTKPVGGIAISVDKFGLLAPYIGLASTILVATAATAIYVKRVKHRKEKQ